MKIAVVSTYTHPSRLPRKEPSIMQSAVPELIAGLCPPDAEIELINEKEVDVPLDRSWDIVFFSYLHAYYEHTKVLSALLRRRGIKTVAGGRHASYFVDDVAKHFDAVVCGDPEANVPALFADFERGELKKVYSLPSVDAAELKPYRHRLVDFSHNRIRLPAIEASRGCPFTCNFCVLTGWEQYRYRPIPAVIDEIQNHVTWNKNCGGLFDNAFIFLDNNLGGSPKYLRELCQALIPLRKTWGCALTYNILRDEELVSLMSKAGCRYIYTGLESLNPESLGSMNKGQNNLKDTSRVVRRTFEKGILLAFGLLVGSDGDTDSYLEKLPIYLDELGTCSITFMGIVCPYPETPFFRRVAEEGRLLPGSISRDYDGYTLCHRPLKLEPKATIEHFKRLCGEVGSLPRTIKQTWTQLWMSDAPRYKAAILSSAAEVASIKNPLRNSSRTFIAGQDPIEEWDLRQMAELGLEPQVIGATAAGIRKPVTLRGGRRIRATPPPPHQRQDSIAPQSDESP